MSDLPHEMRAVVARGPGKPDVLEIQTRPVPRPGPGEILVRVRAAGVNRPDVLQRLGAYPPPPGAPDILGLEVAGEVAATGEGASRFPLGTPVMALVPGGGYAEYALAHETNALPCPPASAWSEAGAIPETYFTVWTNVFDAGASRQASGSSSMAARRASAPPRSSSPRPSGAG
jgi:NADPH2:quinone reductase